MPSALIQPSDPQPSMPGSLCAIPKLANMTIPKTGDLTCRLVHRVAGVKGSVTFPARRPTRILACAARYERSWT